MSALPDHAALSYEEIAQALGITRQRVEQIERGALAKLRSRWALLRRDPEQFARLYESGITRPGERFLLT